jgi:hypothetical protein
VLIKAPLWLDLADSQKSDLWLTLSAASAEGVRGAIGFRQISSASIFATGQPTEVGISSILRIVKERCPAVHNVIWVCLREEPLVMINGTPEQPNPEQSVAPVLTSRRVTVLPPSRFHGLAQHAGLHRRLDFTP